MRVNIKDQGFRKLGIINSVCDENSTNLTGAVKDNTLHRFRLCKIDNIHNEKETNHTDSTLYEYINMPIVDILYGYQESELNHMRFVKISVLSGI